jgi:hypothetical protein
MLIEASVVAGALTLAPPGFWGDEHVVLATNKLVAEAADLAVIEGGVVS